MTSGELISLVAALGLGAILQALINAWLNRHREKIEIEKTRAEVANIEAETAESLGNVWKGLLDELQKKIQNQEKRIKMLEDGEATKNNKIKALEEDLAKKDLQIISLEEEIEELRKFIKGLGYQPPPRKKTRKIYQND